jgi:hypothetical protein
MSEKEIDVLQFVKFLIFNKATSEGMRDANKLIT